MEGNLIMADNEFTQYINDILADYFSTCNIEPFDCQIIISDDMATSVVMNTSIVAILG